MSEEGNRGAGEVREREQKQEQGSSTHPRPLHLLKFRDPAFPPAPFLEFHPPKALPVNSVLPPPLPRRSTLLVLSPRSLLALSELAVLLALPLKMPSALSPPQAAPLASPVPLVTPPLPRILRFLAHGFRPASYLTNHAVPDSIDLLAMLAIGDQVEVIAKANGVRQPLQNVNAEALAAPLLRAGSVRRRAAGSEQAWRGWGPLLGSPMR